MFMNGCQRREVEAPPDFFQARRVAVVLDELVQVIEDFTLPFREREHFIPPVGRGGETIMRTEGEDQGRRRAIFAYRFGAPGSLHESKAGPTLEKASLGERV